MYWDLRSDFSLDFLLFLLSVIAFQIPCMLLWSSVALTAFCDPPFHFSFALSLLSFVSMLANEDPLSKVCCNQKMPLFYFIFVFCFFLSFPLFLLLLHFSVPFVCLFFFFVFFSFLFLSVSFHSGRPPKYSTTTTSSTAVPELGCNPLLSPTSSLPASPAPERPETGGFPLSVHPHSVPQPSPSSGEVSSHLPSLGDHVVESPNYYYCSSRVLYITGCPPPPQPFTTFILYTSKCTGAR